MVDPENATLSPRVIATVATLVDLHMMARSAQELPVEEEEEENATPSRMVTATVVTLVAFLMAELVEEVAVEAVVGSRRVNAMPSLMETATVVILAALLTSKISSLLRLEMYLFIASTSSLLYNILP